MSSEAAVAPELLYKCIEYNFTSQTLSSGNFEVNSFRPHKYMHYIVLHGLIVSSFTNLWINLRKIVLYDLASIICLFIQFTIFSVQPWDYSTNCSSFNYAAIKINQRWLTCYATCRHFVNQFCSQPPRTYILNFG